MSNEPSEHSTNFSNFFINSSPGSDNITEPLLDLVNSLLNSTSNSNNFIINTPNFNVSNTIPSGDEATPSEQEFANNDISTNDEETNLGRTIGITPSLLQVRGRRYEIPQTVPSLNSIPERNPLIDFLSFVENNIITPQPPPPLRQPPPPTPLTPPLRRPLHPLPPPPPLPLTSLPPPLPPPPPLPLTSLPLPPPINDPQQTDDEGNTEPTSNESDTETLPLRSTRHRLAMRSINRNRNRQSGVFFQQFMTRLMDNADEQILQQVMHESFVEDQEKRLIDQARELDIEKDKYDKNNKILENFSTCRICFSEYKDGEEIGVLPCNHFFHCECIQEWGKRRPVCPFCEINIPTVNEQVAKKQKRAKK
jgi:hypothetical protein